MSDPSLPCPRTHVGVSICCSQCRREYDAVDLLWLQSTRRTAPLCTDCIKRTRGRLVQVRVELDDDSDIDSDIEKTISARPPHCPPGMR